MDFNAKEYWNNRLNEEFSLKGVGYFTFSARYNKWLYRRKKEVLNKVFARNLPALKDRKVVDIGCGTGFFVRAYLAKGASVTGVDITDKSIAELSRLFPDSHFRQLDVGSKTGSLDEKFDLVNMWDVMYHIVDEAAFRQACQNIVSMSRENTYFLATDLLGAGKSMSPAKHVVFRSLRDYDEALGPGGYRLQQVIPLYRFLNRQYPWGDKITNALAPLLYFMDNRNHTVMPYNLSLGIWKLES